MTIKIEELMRLSMAASDMRNQLNAFIAYCEVHSVSLVDTAVEMHLRVLRRKDKEAQAALEQYRIVSGQIQ